jgi:hypothetical protein
MAKLNSPSQPGTKISFEDLEKALGVNIKSDLQLDNNKVKNILKLCNDDGFSIRSSGYHITLSRKGVFILVSIYSSEYVEIKIRNKINRYDSNRVPFDYNKINDFLNKHKPATLDEIRAERVTDNSLPEYNIDFSKDEITYYKDGTAIRNSMSKVEEIVLVTIKNGYISTKDDIANPSKNPWFCIRISTSNGCVHVILTNLERWFYVDNARIVKFVRNTHFHKFTPADKEMIVGAICHKSYS